MLSQNKFKFYKEKYEEMKGVVFLNKLLAESESFKEIIHDALILSKTYTEQKEIALKEKIEAFRRKINLILSDQPSTPENEDLFILGNELLANLASIAPLNKKIDNTPICPISNLKIKEKNEIPSASGYVFDGDFLEPYLEICKVNPVTKEDFNPFDLMNMQQQIKVQKPIEAKPSVKAKKVEAGSVFVATCATLISLAFGITACVFSGGSAALLFLGVLHLGVAALGIGGLIKQCFVEYKEQTSQNSSNDDLGADTKEKDSQLDERLSKKRNPLLPFYTAQNNQAANVDEAKHENVVSQPLKLATTEGSYPLINPSSMRPGR